MPTATMTSKGQLTIPVEVRRRLGLVPGSRVDFTEDELGFRLESRRVCAASLYGVLAKPLSPATIEEMEAGIAQGAAASMGSR